MFSGTYYLHHSYILAETRLPRFPAVVVRLRDVTLRVVPPFLSDFDKLVSQVLLSVLKYRVAQRCRIFFLLFERAHVILSVA